MDGPELVWEHFKLNAEQRLRGFNFFVLLTIFANGGVFTAIERELDPTLLIVIGLFIVLLAVVFWLVDARSGRLLNLTVPALKEIESTFPESYRIFSTDESQRSYVVRYTFAIRAMLIAQLMLGLGVILYGMHNYAF